MPLRRHRVRPLARRALSWHAVTPTGSTGWRASGSDNGGYVNLKRQLVDDMTKKRQWIDDMTRKRQQIDDIRV